MLNLLILLIDSNILCSNFHTMNEEVNIGIDFLNENCTPLLQRLKQSTHTDSKSIPFLEIISEISRQLKSTVVVLFCFILFFYQLLISCIGIRIFPLE